MIPDKNNTSKKAIRYFQEYCNCSSIHGLRYLGEKKRSFYERTWWIIAVAMAFIFCGTLIVDTYREWSESPIILTLANIEMPIWQIPFPAVTICPEFKVNPEIFNYSEVLYKIRRNESVTTDERTNFEKMSLICRHRSDVTYEWEYFNGTDLFDFYHNLSMPSKNFLIMAGSFNGKIYHNYMPIVTKDGVCYTLNMLNREEIYKEFVVKYKNYHQSAHFSKGWHFEGRYESDSEEFVYPERAFSSGIPSSLNLHFARIKKREDYLCDDGIGGYKVHIHHPATLPSVKHNYFVIPTGQAVQAAINPQIILTSREVKLYKPESRGCYFSSEKPLYYFKFYSQNNCLIECQTNYTLAMCNCVHFYMPHNNDTLICGGAKQECIRNAEKMFIANLQNTKQEKEKIKSDDYLLRIPLISCGCLPTCNSIKYAVETSYTDWNVDNVAEAEANLKNTTNIFRSDRIRFSKLELFFRSNHFLPLVRQELYSPTKLLANFGGILGFFTGFSLLSLVELIYFLSLRIYCKFVLRHK